MRSIGIRVTPSEVFYCIIEENEEGYVPISISSIKIPKALDLPNKLSYIRNTIFTIINQYGVVRAGIKLMESNAQLSASANTFFRLNLEGVVLELFSNSTIEQYLPGVASNISSILGLKMKKVKDLAIDFGIDDTVKTDGNKKLKDEDKEAIVVAIAALVQE